VACGTCGRAVPATCPMVNIGRLGMRRKRSDIEEEELVWKITKWCFLIAIFAQIAKLVINIIAIVG
jgi:hypothetical protein